MHVLLGIAVLGGLIGIAFGKNAARAFIGTCLAFLAVFFGFALMLIVEWDGGARQAAKAETHTFDMAKQQPEQKSARLQSQMCIDHPTNTWWCQP